MEAVLYSSNVRHNDGFTSLQDALRLIKASAIYSKRKKKVHWFYLKSIEVE